MPRSIAPTCGAGSRSRATTTAEVGAAIAAIATIHDLADWTLKLRPLLDAFGEKTREVQIEIAERCALFADPTLNP